MGGAFGGAEGEELVGEVGEPGDVDGELVEHGLVLGNGAGATTGELDPALDERQGCAELVAGFVDEPALALEGALEGGEHLVEGVSEPSDLVVTASWHVEAQSVRAAGDLGGASSIAFDGTQCGAGEEVAHHCRDRECPETGESQLEEELAQSFVAVVASNADDQVVVARVERGDLDAVGLVGDREQLADVLGERACADVVEIGRGHQRRGGRCAAGVDDVAGARRRPAIPLRWPWRLRVS